MDDFTNDNSDHSSSFLDMTELQAQLVRATEHLNRVQKQNSEMNLINKRTLEKFTQTRVKLDKLRENYAETVDENGKLRQELESVEKTWNEVFKDCETNF